jgi:hypothetical protein
VNDAATVRQAIETWHGLLGDEGLAAGSAERMEDDHRRRGMYFGDRPLCSVLRPRMLTHAQYAWIRRQVGTLMSAYRKIHERAMADDGFRAQFHLLDWEEEIVHFDPGFRSPCPTSRLDTFFSAEDGTLKVTEYSTRCCSRSRSGRAAASCRASASWTGQTCRRRASSSSSATTSARTASRRRSRIRGSASTATAS